MTKEEINLLLWSFGLPIVLVIFPPLIINKFWPTENPFKECSLQSTEHTGKQRRSGAKVYHTKVEVIKVYHCNGERKVEVVWERE